MDFVEKENGEGETGTRVDDLRLIEELKSKILDLEKDLASRPDQTILKNKDWEIFSLKSKISELDKTVNSLNLSKQDL